MNKKLIYLFIVLLTLVFLYRVRTILAPFFFAAIIAYIAYPLVRIFEKREVPRPAAILLVYSIFGVVAGVLVSFLIPQLARELEDILRLLPQQTERLEGLGLDAIRSLEQIRIPGTFHEVANLIINRIQVLLESFANRLAELLVGVLSQLLALAISPFLAFYMLRDEQAIKRRFFMYIPKAFRQDVYYLFKETNKLLNGFIRGQLAISGIVGLLIAAGLALLGIRYSLFIGLLAGLFDIIPYFGPVIGIIPAIVLAMLKSPTYVLWVIIVFVIVNQIEANVIAPKVIGDRVGLHPLAVVFAVLAGGEVFGVMGMLIAVPIAAMIRVLLRFFTIKMEGRPV